MDTPEIQKIPSYVAFSKDVGDNRLSWTIAVPLLVNEPVTVYCQQMVTYSFPNVRILSNKMETHNNAVPHFSWPPVIQLNVL